jgi:hypothetical protein
MTAERLQDPVFKQSYGFARARSFRARVEAAALAERYRETVVLCTPPRFVQRVLLPALSRFAHRDLR